MSKIAIKKTCILFLALGLLLFAMGFPAYAVEKNSIFVYYDESMGGIDPGALTEVEQRPNYLTNEQVIARLTLTDAEKKKYREQIANALTATDYTSLREGVIANAVTAAKRDSDKNGFGTNGIPDDAYFGNGFRPLQILQDKYITVDPSKEYFPLCSQQKIIGILTVARTASGLTATLEKSYGNYLTKLLAAPISCQLIDFDGNLVLCKDDQDGYQAISGGSVSSAYIGFEGSLLYSKNTSFKPNQISQKAYKLVIDSAYPESSISGRLIVPRYCLNGSGDTSMVVWQNDSINDDYSGKIFYIKNHYSELNLQADGNRVTQELFTGAANQQFMITDKKEVDGKTVYSIQPMSSAASQRLTVANNKNGTKLQVMTSNSNIKTQQFELKMENEYTFQLILDTKVVEIAGPSKKPGAMAQLWSNEGKSNQKWQLIHVSE